MVGYGKGPSHNRHCYVDFLRGMGCCECLRRVVLCTPRLTRRNAMTVEELNAIIQSAAREWEPSEITKLHSTISSAVNEALGRKRLLGHITALAPVISERNRAVLKMRDDGMTYADIGQYFNLTSQRIRAIYTRDKPKEVKGALHLPPLIADSQVRTAVKRALDSAGITTWSDLLDKPASYLMMLPNVGVLSLAEIKRQMNMRYQDFVFPID